MKQRYSNYVVLTEEQMEILNNGGCVVIGNHRKKVLTKTPIIELEKKRLEKQYEEKLKKVLSKLGEQVKDDKGDDEK